MIAPDLPVVVTDPADLAVRGCVLAIGNFDGVHLGHRQLLDEMRRLSEETGKPAVVVSFYPTSRMVFANSGALSTADEKVLLLSEWSPSAVVLIPFSVEYAARTSQEFLAELSRLEPEAIVVGDDFRFGHDRAGTAADLAQVTGRLVQVPMVQAAGGNVSSSRIRELLLDNRLDEARRLLGRPYMILGRVVPGAQRGRTIGVPTANLSVPAGKVLPQGVYAVQVRADGRWLSGMANIGLRPSFEEKAPALEVNVFDFSGDLYGSVLEVRLIMHLRGQLKFDSLDDLKAQLQQDAIAARAALKGER